MPVYGGNLLHFVQNVVNLGVNINHLCICPCPTVVHKIPTVTNSKRITRRIYCYNFEIIKLIYSRLAERRTFATQRRPSRALGRVETNPPEEGPRLTIVPIGLRPSPGSVTPARSSAEQDRRTRRCQITEPARKHVVTLLIKSQIQIYLFKNNCRISQRHG